MKRSMAMAGSVALGLVVAAAAQTPGQPKVTPGPNEPDWDVILRDRYGLSMYGDLANPVRTKAEQVPGLFHKSGPGPVRYRPVIALGLEKRTRGGWYPAEKPEGKAEVWSYTYKNTTEDIRTGKNLPPPLAEASSTEFDPGDRAFGVWIANDQFPTECVYSEPGLVARHNPRLARQPYKAMIYPNRDRATGKAIPHSYLIGWEYSTNDDFQDAVCQIDNVTLDFGK